MTRWRFRIIDSPPDSVDASSIRRCHLEGRTVDEIASIELVAEGLTVPLGELFEIEIDPSENDSIVVEGSLENVHGLGAFHDRGRFHLIGDAGNYVGASMTGGRILAESRVGGFVGAPLGPKKIGMSGGEIEILGSAGDYVGHRMRRGTIIIHQSAGDLLGASMIAGTIGVGQGVAGNLCVAMKRGTVILPRYDGGLTSAGRFSKPEPFFGGFLSLFTAPQIRELLKPLAGTTIRRVRADRNVGGLGEILMPA